MARTRLGEESLAWEELASADGEVLRQWSYESTPIASRSAPGQCLLDASLRPIHKYKFYVHLLTESAWHVPVLQGRLPRVPDVDAKIDQCGKYGLFLMMLFRPYRQVEDLILLALGAKNFGGDEEEAWLLVKKEFDRWRKD